MEYKTGFFKIKIKYFSPDMPRLEKIDGGDWLDLRSAERVVLHQYVYALIPLGVAMQLPDGYEAIIVPRSSSFKKWGALQTNGLGVIDESYAGDADQWHWCVYPTRDAVIEKYDRVCQFRIQIKQPSITFEEVQALGKSRGGFGSTGYK